MTQPEETPVSFIPSNFIEKGKILNGTFDIRNAIESIVLSLAIGIGFTTASESGIWSLFPQLVQSVFSANVVAVVFVVSIILSLVLPKDMDIKRVEEK